MLLSNDYEAVKANHLKYFGLALQKIDVPEIHFGNIAKHYQLGIVIFRTTVINEEIDSEELKLKILEAISKDEYSCYQEI